MGDPVRSAWKRCAAVLCLVCSTAYAQTDTPDYTARVEAVWMPQEVELAIYAGANAWYSCRALHEKIGDVLTAVGAHEGLTIEVTGCGPDQMVNSAFVRITFASPVPATEEIVRRLTTHDSRAELVARLTGVPLATAGTIERFPAVWQTVKLAPNRKLGMRPSDCELLRELNRKLLPRLALHTRREYLTCMSQSRAAQPQLTVVALIPAG